MNKDDTMTDSLWHPKPPTELRGKPPPTQYNKDDLIAIKVFIDYFDTIAGDCSDAAQAEYENKIAEAAKASLVRLVG